MSKGRKVAFLKTGIACAVGAALAAPAYALDFEFGDGWTGNFSGSASLGTSWRTRGADPTLFGAANAGLSQIANPAIAQGHNTIDEGNHNYGKGDPFTTLFKVFGELEVKKGTMGALVRAKAWYDYTLNNDEVRFGNGPNGYNGFNGATLGSRKALSDKGFEPLAKFDGLYLLDAYAYDTFNVGGHDLQIRVGNQVVNWGESLFIQGLNQINPIDVPANRKPGAQLKEVFLPVPILFASLNLGQGNGSVEGFWQWKYQNTPIEAGCGNYWSVALGNIYGGGTGGCYNATPAVFGSNPFSQFPGSGVFAVGALDGTGALANMANALSLGVLPAGTLYSNAWAAGAINGTNAEYVPTLQGKKPRDGRDFGLAYRFNIDSLDTEFGIYGMNISARTPTVGIEFAKRDGAGNLVPFAGHNTMSPMASRWQYAEDMQLFGISATTTIFGWSVAAELNHTNDFPAQIDGNDILGAGLNSAYTGIYAHPLGAATEAAVVSGAAASGAFGPVGPMAAAQWNKAGGGGVLEGWVKTKKTQFQINALQVGNGVAAAEQWLLIGEVGFQWNDLPNYKSNPMNIRINRPFIFGQAPQGTFALGAGDAGVCAANPNNSGCKNQGYVTPFAWGYRILGQLTYNDVFGTGITAQPNMFFSHDVKGYSVDSQFNEDRMALSVGVKFNYKKMYTLELSNVTYNHAASYDPLRDRDFFSIVAGINF